MKAGRMRVGRMSGLASAAEWRRPLLGIGPCAEGHVGHLALEQQFVASIFLERWESIVRYAVASVCMSVFFLWRAMWLACMLIGAHGLYRSCVPHTSRRCAYVLIRLKWAALAMGVACSSVVSAERRSGLCLCSADASSWGYSAMLLDIATALLIGPSVSRRSLLVQWLGVGACAAPGNVVP